MVKKPKLKTVGCEACAFRNGEPYLDDTEDKVMRVYCKARFVAVDLKVMSDSCDHFKVNPQENKDD